MPEKLKSVMLLPKNENRLLLQSFTNPDGVVTWDGFGSFYSSEEDPASTAERVFKEYFKSTALHVRLKERARLNYLIDKPSGLVDLDVTVYFVDIDSSLPIPDHTKLFASENIPYAQMHQATGKWLPLLLEGSESINAQIKLKQSSDHTIGMVTEFTVNKR
ncbi:MAG: hypothetical protein KIH63_002535 [Candidatus Saccharibacteria bacterium]|nr:hypothetical protein [Candidatus Saccharibacteria bacterium]